ncbi:MAG TPA: nucleotide pyrophosphohydrolase [Verrucomicrobiae bacterium]|nr:nucleotide pyrophosphohydrolase [Verrucomicrobiae bacterium]
MSQPAAQSDMTFEEISQIIWDHQVQRDWQRNPPRALAISIALEANELLEHYQWQDEPVGKKDELAAELADILIYAFQFAHRYDIDIPKAISAKLEKAAEKYPAEHFKGKTSDEQQKVWLQQKTGYTKKGL